ncbi:hypothetical protein [Sphingobium sp. Ant17]|uniref:hypothetical protein n=1 Tax=Sphingobium sp. Ant17 TaxID=1461752 RepID=UPI0004528C41|nr:hypothetical protein [Sphingobium sp. Ant17]EXS70230.1 hypothetical protein BF95_25145 [Sphingobium sp. Ant17]
MANMAQAFSGILNIATASSSTVVGSVNFVHKGVSGLNIIAEQWLEDLQESEVINKDHRRQKLVTQNAKAEATYSKRSINFAETPHIPKNSIPHSNGKWIFWKSMIRKRRRNPPNSF